MVPSRVYPGPQRALMILGDTQHACPSRRDVAREAAQWLADSSTMEGGSNRCFDSSRTAREI
jgi:hypothetical protein